MESLIYGTVSDKRSEQWDQTDYSPPASKEKSSKNDYDSGYEPCDFVLTADIVFHLKVHPFIKFSMCYAYSKSGISRFLVETTFLFKT